MYVFSVGQQVKVIDSASPRFNQTGAVVNVAPEGYTNNEPPTPFGERDMVQFTPGNAKDNGVFGPAQLELVS